jgi:hypothetical protein
LVAFEGSHFTLGLTTLIDLLVVFIFTKPIVTVIAKMNFFASGHPLSGFSAYEPSVNLIQLQALEASAHGETLQA